MNEFSKSNITKTNSPGVFADAV